MSGSELASFGERVLADIERRLGEVTAFKSTAGRQAAHAAAKAVHLATIEVAELEQSFALTPDGSLGPAPGAPEENPGHHHRGAT